LGRQPQLGRFLDLFIGKLRFPYLGVTYAFSLCAQERSAGKKLLLHPTNNESGRTSGSFHRNFLRMLLLVAY